MNRVILVGNLTRDPELRATSSGLSVCTFSIAVNRRVSREAQAQGQRDADFFNIVTWRALADNCSRYLAKGRKVAVVGSLQNRSYDANDGTKRYITEIVADDVEFLTPAGSSEPRQSMPEEAHPANSFHAPAPFNEGIQPVEEDELPF
ncbi:MAG: single-stranded DNA-binding protein [Clostridiales bacterium]|nr:single-stranded DNA-binding protein [Clostridiales bacterium]